MKENLVNELRKKQGLMGLEEHSRAPKHIPHKTPKEIEERVIELRKSHLIEIDTKDLWDIEKYWPQMKRLRLPRYEFTVRNVRTGVSGILMGRPKMGLTPQSLQAIHFLKLNTME